MPLDARHQDLLIDLVQTGSLVQSRLEQAVLAEADLSFSGYIVLDVLFHEGDQEARRLADEANVARGTLTGIVGRLESRGLVDRLPHASDRRSIIVTITDKGRALFETLRPRVLAEQSSLLHDTDLEHLTALASLLDSVGRRADLGD